MGEKDHIYYLKRCIEISRESRAAGNTPFGALLTGPDRVFIDNYAMTFPAEDRARIFECACTPGNEEDFASPILQAKLQRICTGIRQAFDLEDVPERFLWEQYLTLTQ